MGEAVVVLGIIFAAVIAVVAIVTDYFRKVAVAKAREESRREIAAYVAEGTMSAEDARKLLDAGRSLHDKIVG